MSKKKEFLIKSEEASLTLYGKYPASRPIEELIKNGLVVIDKPPGPTSHQVSAWIKDILNIKKASHGGTLDPRVSGVLIVALENATKLMPILLKSKKEYVVIMNLHKDLPEEKIRKTCLEFVGKIKQIPPKKSAVARKERERKIYDLVILEIQGRDVLMKVECEAGVYIRKLCSDIAKKLGTKGHMQELRRIKSGSFTEKQTVKLQDLKDAFEFWKQGNENYLREIIYPLERTADNMKNVIVKDSAIHNIVNGAPLYVNGISRIQEGIKKGETIGMISLKGELIALGASNMKSEEMFKSRKGLAVKTDRVIIDKNIYPKA